MGFTEIGLILGGNVLQAFGSYLGAGEQQKAAEAAEKRAREHEERMFERQLEARRVTVAPGMAGTQFQARGRIGAAAPTAAPTMSPDQALQMRQQGQI